MIKRTQQGFTLLEVLATVSVASILMFAAAPMVQGGLQSETGESMDVVSLLHEARQQAVYTESKVTVCPVDALKRCSSDWLKPVVAFNDANDNQRLDEGETLISELAENKDLKKMEWISAEQSSVILFNSDGGVGDNFGKLMMEYAEVEQALKVVIPTSGNARLSSRKA